MLALIEWRFGLAPLSVRDAKAANLATARDFTLSDASAPRFAVPDVTSVTCP